MDADIPILNNLKMSEEEQRDYDAFSLASVSVSKRPWRAQEDSKVSKPQPQNVSVTRQARPQAVAKAQSVKSAQSDQRSVQRGTDFVLRIHPFSLKLPGRSDLPWVQKKFWAFGNKSPSCSQRKRYRSQESEYPHSCTSFPYVHDKLF